MDNIEALQQLICAAAQDQRPIAIVGGGTKSFYGREVIGDPLLTSGYQGMIEYQPTELVMTAKAGTPLEKINQVLAEHNQKLGFEAPDYGSESTLGGVIATGLCGCSRPYSGGIQDYVLGIKLLSGTGEVLSFGGQVIKNVAGFDLSRLMVGAMGCLGIILEVSMKVVPIAESEKTVCLQQKNPDDAIATMNSLAGQPVAITASAWCDGKTWIRLSGSEEGVDAAFWKIQKQPGGQIFDSGHIDRDQVNNGQVNKGEANKDQNLWKSLSNTSHPFFCHQKKIYRVSVVPSTPSLLDWDSKQCLVDWGGALRWYCSDHSEQDFGEKLKSAVQEAGGHITVFRNGDRKKEVLAAVNPVIMKLQQRLKAVFDPYRIFNPGRMYEDI